MIFEHKKIILYSGFIDEDTRRSSEYTSWATVGVSFFKTAVADIHFVRSYCVALIVISTTDCCVCAFGQPARALSNPLLPANEPVRGVVGSKRVYLVVSVRPVCGGVCVHVCVCVCVCKCPLWSQGFVCMCAHVKRKANKKS